MISALPGDTFTRLPNADEFERYIARTLTKSISADYIGGPLEPWDESWDPEEFVSTCRVHGVSALIAAAHENGTISMPQVVSSTLNDLLASHRIFDVLHRERLNGLWRELALRRVRPILLKGSALALTEYQEPALRSRGDTDLFIDGNDLVVVDETLRRLGYEPFFESQMQTASYQRAYTLTDLYGFEHTFDVHWRLSNRQIFAAALPWTDLIENTITEPDGDLELLTLNATYQLLHLCAHRTAHLTSPQFSQHLTPSGDRLLWLYDIYLVSRHMNEDQWSRLAEISQDKQICSIVHAAIESASNWFPVSIPETARQKMLDAGQLELARHLLTGSRVRTLMVDILSLQRWQDRVDMLSDAAFPPSDQLLSIYGKTRKAWLPWLYIHRLLGRRP